MSRAGRALKQVLDAYGISQNKLALLMGVSRGVVNNWVAERNSPTSDGIIEIRDALKSIEPSAAEEFIRLYLEG